jgi:hypothetical protein
MLISYMERHGSNTSSNEFEQAYWFMTNSEKRKAVFKVWFLMKLVPSDKQTR